jgi:hypothetical protein
MYLPSEVPADLAKSDKKRLKTLVDMLATNKVKAVLFTQNSSMRQYEQKFEGNTQAGYPQVPVDQRVTDLILASHEMRVKWGAGDFSTKLSVKGGGFISGRLVFQDWYGKDLADIKHAAQALNFLKRVEPNPDLHMRNLREAIPTSVVEDAFNSQVVKTARGLGVAQLGNHYKTRNAHYSGTNDK